MKIKNGMIIIDEYVCKDCCDENPKDDGVMLKIIRAIGRCPK